MSCRRLTSGRGTPYDEYVPPEPARLDGHDGIQVRRSMHHFSSVTDGRAEWDVMTARLTTLDGGEWPRPPPHAEGGEEPANDWPRSPPATMTLVYQAMADVPLPPVRRTTPEDGFWRHHRQRNKLPTHMRGRR